jgi:ATP-binding cassette subfamily C protein CydC
MTTAALLEVLRRTRGGRPALAVALIGAFAEHGGAVVAGAAAGWLAGTAAAGERAWGPPPR